MAYQSEIEKLEQRFGEKPEQWFAALADAYRKAGELDMALDILNIWVEKRPNYTSGYIVLGRCLLDKEQHDQAQKAFQEVLELDPENIIAVKALSEIAARRGDTAEARQWLERLLEVDPMNEEAHQALESLGAEGAAAAEPQQEPPAAEAAAKPGPAPTPFGAMSIADQMKRDMEERRSREAAVVEEAEPTAAVEEVTLDEEPEAPAAAELDVAPPSAVEAPAAAEVEATPPGGIEAPDLDVTPPQGLEAPDLAVTPGEGIEAPDLDVTPPQGLEAPEVAPSPLPETLPETPAIEGLEPPADVPPRDSVPVAGLEAVDSFEELKEEAKAEAPPPAPGLQAPDLPVTPPAPPPPAPPPRPAAAEAAPDAPLPLILPEEVAEPEPEPVTETMAELYARQGLHQEAAAVYEQLLARQPGNAELAARLAEVRALGAAKPAPAAAPQPRLSAAVTGGQSVRSLLAEMLGTAPAAGAPPPAPEAAPPAAPAAPAPAPTPAEPPPAAAQPPSAAPEAPPPGPDAPAPAPETPAAPEPEQDDFSFDQFFGDKEEKPGDTSGPSTRRAAEERSTDDDFRDWLKGLKG